MVPDPGSSTVYAGTNEGLLVSADGGTTWTRRPLAPPEQIFALAFDPADASTIWAATGQGVSSTRDRGVTWTTVSLPPYRVPARDLRWARRSGFYPEALEAAASQFSQGKYSFKSIVTLRGAKTTVLAASLGVFRSADGGETWRRIGIASAHLSGGEEGVEELVVDPHDPRTVYAATSGGVAASHDAGATWGRLKGSPFVTALVADPRTAGTLYAGTVKSGIVRSSDAGKSWTPLGGDLATAYVRSLAVGPPGTLYAEVQDQGLFTSTDGARSWTHSLSFGWGMPLAITIDPRVATTLYVGTYRGIWRTNDGGQRWRRVYPPEG